MSVLLPAGVAKSPSAWIAITAGTAFLAHFLINPVSCHTVKHCSNMHKEMDGSLHHYVGTALAVLLLHELMSHYINYTSAVKAHASELIKNVRSWFLPSQLIVACFAILTLQHAVISFSKEPWYAHVSANSLPYAQAPVYTSTYVEWLINVPFLLVLSGKCALGRSNEEVAGPLIITNVYMVMSWAAFLVEGTALRWTLVIVSFLMYFWASADMLGWIRDFRMLEPLDAPGRDAKCCLTLALIVTFGIYGIVYLAAITGYIAPANERFLNLINDMITKVAVSIAFGGIRSCETMDLLIEMLIQTNIPFKRQVTEGHMAHLPARFLEKGDETKSD